MGSIKSLPCRGLLLLFYELMALKSRSYIFDLDHVNMSLGIFFNLLNGDLITPAFRICLHLLSKTLTKKRQT